MINMMTYNNLSQATACSQVLRSLSRVPSPTFAHACFHLMATFSKKLVRCGPCKSIMSSTNTVLPAKSMEPRQMSILPADLAQSVAGPLAQKRHVSCSLARHPKGWRSISVPPIEGGSLHRHLGCIISVFPTVPNKGCVILHENRL